jgi:hypothetical protein
MGNEPVITAVSISAIVSAALGLLIVFGIDIKQDQVEAILAFVGVVAPLVVGALVARSKVTPVRKLRERQNAADPRPRV